MAAHVWNLRSQRSFRVIHAAIRGARRRPGLRVVHFAVMGNHLHLIARRRGRGPLPSGSAPWRSGSRSA
jgi:hypothetical protein